MSIDAFLKRIKHGERPTFPDTLAVIAEHYRYIPTRFCNGVGNDRVVNEAGSNEGSCKIFYFAKLHALSQHDTLVLFGDFYWDDVLNHPDASNHANIRTFMKHGWAGVTFDGEALQALQP